MVPQHPSNVQVFDSDDPEATDDLRCHRVNDTLSNPLDLPMNPRQDKLGFGSVLRPLDASRDGPLSALDLTLSCLQSLRILERGSVRERGESLDPNVNPYRRLAFATM